MIFLFAEINNSNNFTHPHLTSNLCKRKKNSLKKTSLARAAGRIQTNMHPPSKGFRPLATGFGPARLFTAALPSVSDEGDRETIILEALQINH